MAAICIQVINPNTNPGMTDTIATAARMAAAPGTEIMAVSAREGVPSIEGHFDEAIAAVGVGADSGRPPAGRFGHVIACFGDPGLLAARELAQGPVIGIAEAAMHLATLVATRFSIVTTPPRTLIIARHLLHQYGFYDRCSGLHAIDLPVLALEDAPARRRSARAVSSIKRGYAAPSCAGLWRNGHPGPGADPRTAGAGHRWRQRGGEDGGVAGGAGSVDQQTRGLSVPGSQNPER